MRLIKSKLGKLPPESCDSRMILRTLYVSAFLVSSVAVGAEELPNIVLVMADDQGWGDMAYNGHPHLKTPNFDAFAKEGIRFDHFHAAAPVCSPTRGSVMTGRTPNRYGTFQPGATIRPQEITIAEALKTKGYRTGHFGKWHLGSVHRESPVSPGASGFDEWLSSPNFFDVDPILSDQGKAVPFNGDSSDVTVDVALKFIRAQVEAKQRFLAVVWFGSPHDPHEPLEADKAIYNGLPAAEANFYGEITAMDRAFGRLRSEIKQLGIREKTLLWYNSDNGALPKVGSSGGRRGNKAQIYEGGLLVPCLVEWPTRFDGERVIKAPAVTSDIYPTVLDIVDATMDNQPVLDGMSLLPLLDGKESKRTKPIGFWNWPKKGGMKTPAKQWMEELLANQTAGHESNDPLRVRPDAAEIKEQVATNSFPGHAAWLDGQWKLHRIQDVKTGDVKWELYDLAADPDESRELYAEQPERVPQMQHQLEDWLESVTRSLNGDDYK